MQLNYWDNLANIVEKMYFSILSPYLGSYSYKLLLRIKEMILKGYKS